MYTIKTLIPLLIILLYPFNLKSEVPNEAYTFDINLELKTENDLINQKFFFASILLKQVIQSEEFRRAILDHRFNGRRSFYLNRGFSNRKIYQIILDGAEKLNNIKNNSLDAEIDFFHRPDSIVMGFTRKNTHKIWINSKYFKRFSPADLAGHLMHEWLHKLGFSHESKWSKNRKFSVPYAIGKIIQKHCRKLLKSTF